MLNLLKSVAVGDQTVASNIATLDNIMSGVDGSATFGYTLEPTSLQVNDNQAQQYLHAHTFDIRVLQGDATTIGILNAIVGNNRNVKITGITPNGFFLWDNPTQLVRNSQFDQVIADQILATVQAPAGYAGTAPNRKLPVYAGGNALALYDILSGSASVMNGFSFVTSALGGMAGVEQEIETPATTAENTVYWRSANIFFPFVGERLTGSITVGTITGGTYKLGIEFVESNGTTIISTSRTSNVSDASLASLTATTPANTVFIRLVITAGTSAVSNESIYVSRPMLALAGLTEFTL
jgi:hypothetical protein